MNEQLPLKRIVSVLSAGVMAAAAICAPGMVMNTAAINSEQRSVLTWENPDENKADASVKALNHEENIKKETKTLKKYEAPVWRKAGLSDYREPLELDELVPTAFPEDQLAEQEAEHPAGGSLVVNADAPGAYTLPPAQPLSTEDYDPDRFYFRAYGKGHGIGMSQNGANYYAKYLGWNYAQILAHYYPGTTIQHRDGDGSEKITVRGITGNVADIVARVCEAEVGQSFSDEAIKAQAVAAYTYIKHEGGSTRGVAIDSSHSPSARILNLVNEVLGQAVFYNDSYALTMFCASSGGYTASNKDVTDKGLDLPYLRSVECDVDAVYDTANYGVLKSISAAELYNRLVKEYGVSLSYDDRDSWLQLIAGDGGYIAYVVIGGQVTVNGYKFVQNCLDKNRSDKDKLATPKFVIEHT